MKNTTPRHGSPDFAPLRPRLRLSIEVASQNLAPTEGNGRLALDAHGILGHLGRISHQILEMIWKISSDVMMAMENEGCNGLTLENDWLVV